MKSFRKQRSSSVESSTRVRSRHDMPVMSAQERMEAYNQSYSRQGAPVRSKRNLRTDHPSSRRNLTAVHARTSQPIRPYSKHSGVNRNATNVTHHRSSSGRGFGFADPRPKPKSFKSTTSFRNEKCNRRLEFQQTQVQQQKSTSNSKRSSRAFQNKSSRELSKQPSRQISMGDETYSDVQSRLSMYKATMGNSYRSDPSYLVPLLAAQAYHIPGNNWFQDWRQFMCNNHPLFGICLHHSLHPIKACTRIIALIGSILFGLVMVNMFYLFYLWNPEFDQTVMSITVDSGNVYTLTTGMLLLWTLGGGIHASFNLCLWYIAACSCCRAGGCCEARAWCPSFGKHLIRGVVLMIVVLTVLVIFMRIAIGDAEDATLDGGSKNDSTNSNGIDFFFTEEAWDFNVEGTEEFHFVLAYLVQMVLSLFVYYPFFATVLMSGALGCHGKVPLLGGRPYEIAQYKRKLERMNNSGNWELSGSPTYLDSYVEGSGELAQNFSFVSDNRDSAHEDDIEIVWTPKAKREFERRWST